jgi:3-oxoacyl-[acyl-carrier protein] reductase
MLIISDSTRTPSGRTSSIPTSMGRGGSSFGTKGEVTKVNLGLEGKVALLTGASRGIGRATARVLAREGADLVISARGGEALRQVAEAVRGMGRKALAVTADVGIQADREHLAAAALEEFGRVDCLVSNATNLDVYRQDAPESALWDAHYHVDVLGAVRLTELLAPGMRERRSGSIVYVSSISGLTGQGSEHGYVAMKAALIAAGKTFAVEFARDGVRVNVVAPGSIYEPGSDWDRQRETDAQGVAALERSIPMGRFGAPDEVASCIAFLLSDASYWVVGHCLVVDGGQFPGI